MTVWTILVGVIAVVGASLLLGWLGHRRGGDSCPGCGPVCGCREMRREEELS